MAMIFPRAYQGGSKPHNNGEDPKSSFTVSLQGVLFTLLQVPTTNHNYNPKSWQDCFRKRFLLHMYGHELNM